MNFLAVITQYNLYMLLGPPIFGNIKIWTHQLTEIVNPKLLISTIWNYSVWRNRTSTIRQKKWIPGI